MKINLRESLNKIDLATDNKYDLLNTFDSKKLSDNSKKKLAEAIDNNSIASINRVLHESSKQLYKVVISSGATKRNFESALYEDEAEGIVDYYGGRWIDENGFEWSMYVEEDDDSTEHAMVDDGQSFESLKEDYDEDVKKVKELITDVNSAFKIATNLIYFIDDDNSLSSLGYETLEMLKDVNKTKYRELLRSISSDIDEEDLRDYGAIDSGILDLLYDSHPIQEYIDSALNYILASKNSKKNDYIKKLASNIIDEVEEDELARFINDDLGDSSNIPFKNLKTSDSKSDDNIVYGIKVAFTEDTDDIKKGSWYIIGTGFEHIARDMTLIKDNRHLKNSHLKDKDFLKYYAYNTKEEAIKDAKNKSRYYQNGEDISIVEINLNDIDESLKEDLDLSEVEEIKELPFDNKRVNNLRGIFSTKALVDALNKTGLDKLKIRTSRLKNVSQGDIKDAWMDLKRKGWFVSITRDDSLKGFNEVYVFEKIINESLTEASYGGAYDIEDDMFFTKEEIVEFADNICEDLAKEFGYKYDIADVYMDSPTKLHIELIDNHDVEVDINVRIDMRRIKKPSDLEKIYHNSTLESFKNRFLEEYQYYEFDESLKESIDISDYEELRYPLRDGDKYYQLYRKIENGKGVWAAAELDKYGSDVVGEPFKITYEQARGFEPIEDSSIRKLSRDLGKKLLPKRENLNEAYRPLAIGYMILKKEIPNHVNYAEFANYDEVVTAIPSEADVVVYPRGGKISGTDIAYWQFDAIDLEGKKTKANFSTYIYSLKDFLNNDEMELKLIPDFKLIDEYPYLIEVDDDIEESLSLKESYIRDIIKLVRDSTNKYSSTYGKFTPARFDSYYINDLFDEFYKNGYSVSYNVLDYSKDYDDLSNQEYWFEKNESLTEDFDDEYESDFDDNEVEEGNHVFADGEEYVWVERISGPIYLDFDKWAVWSAREYVDPREFMTIHDNGKDYDFDGDAFKKKAMAAPIVYFVVEEDTGFIDWGPVESRIEAQDFLNGKQEDWDNDEYYGESLEKNLDEWYVHTIHYEDIGDGREYDYEVDHEEVLDYLSEIAIDEEDAPEDTEEYLKWVEDNFDELFNKYEYEIEEHFREDASQEEYDRRHSSYES